MLGDAGLDQTGTIWETEIANPPVQHRNSQISRTVEGASFRTQCRAERQGPFEAMSHGFLSDLDISDAIVWAEHELSQSQL